MSKCNICGSHTFYICHKTDGEKKKLEVYPELLKACKDGLRMLNYMKEYPFDTADIRRKMKKAIVR